MSRGHGSVQREILAELRKLEPGQVLLIGGGWPSGRRAARRLADEGLVLLVTVRQDSRNKLAVKPGGVCRCAWR